ncbi:DUF924 family protein [Thiomicrorhabdus hydrogeniphila]
MANITPQSLLTFWFSGEMQPRWFNSTPQIDETIRNQYEALWNKAKQGELNEWKNTPQGALALIILLDQFPLNMFRGQAKAFSTEALAIENTKYAIEQKFDQQIPKSQLMFMYMPLMHSEDLNDQTLSLKLFTQAALTNNIRFAQHHKNLVQRFGRFPHRNAILGRTSTPEELSYLASDEAFTG